eukprot:10724514-Alexandrium_andersonii.AAC.1
MQWRSRLRLPLLAAAGAASAPAGPPRLLRPIRRAQLCSRAPRSPSAGHARVRSSGALRCFSGKLRPFSVKTVTACSTPGWRQRTPNGARPFPPSTGRAATL